MITRSKSKRTAQRIESEDVGYKHVTSPSSSSSKSQLSLYSSSSSSCFRSPTISLSSSSSSNLGLTDVAQEAESVQVPVPNVSAAEVRKRWSKEMNEFILRTYLLLTNMESDTNAYLPPLHTKFLEKYPYMEVSRQRIGDQRRAIIQKNLLPKTTIDRIYKEVRIELQTNNNYHSAQLLSNTGTQIGQRMKWTKEYNESILKIYLRITQLESNKTAYRKLLHEEFIATHPELGHLSEQRIADQRRAIINNKYITDNRLAEIKQEISNELKIQNRENNYSQSLGTQPQQQLEAANINNTYTSHEEANIHTEEQALSGDNTLQELTAPIYNTTETTVDLNQKIESTFHEAEQLFANTDPTSRPFIRRQKLTKKFSTIVQYINTTILPTKLHPDIEFNTLHNILYCAAWTAAKCNGTKIEQQLQEIHHTQTKKIPSWQKRLEKQIADLRASIGRVTQFINGNRSRRIISTVETIKLKYATHAQHENSNSDPKHFLDTLKQKLSAKSARLKRYLKCTARKKQNAIFISNEKGFYRTLNSSENNTINRNNNIPSKEALREFWANIWENPEQHSDNTEWIKELQQETSGICDMEFEFIPADIFIDVIQRTHNWKAPGTDHIHNYWYKKFTCLYPYIHNHINAFIQSPHTLPTFITHGITYMLPKDPDDTCNPAKYRPITCLQTFYKILTACISRVINQHLTKYNILAEQQKGCRKDSQGCKEQLTIDAIAMKTATNQKKDIYSMFIDYQKAFDSVPHSWLLEVLNLYKIHPVLTNFLKTSMTNWQTALKIKSSCETLTTEPIQIQRGIFQGDALSPLWFCLALNPLSQLLDKSNEGFLLENNNTHYKLSHLMYMDDIKLFAADKRTLFKLADITQTFSQDIRMQFGVDKCKILSISKGKIREDNYTLENGEIIEPMTEHNSYKYLGFKQLKQIAHKETILDLKKRFTHRLRLILKTHLNSKNTIKAINTFAIPILTYSFGIINWSKTDLQSLQRTVNTNLTKYRKHHPKSCVQRLTLPRSEGGRGLIDIQNLHNQQIRTLRSYFHTKSEHSLLHKHATQLDKKLTPLNLHDTNPQQNEHSVSIQQKLLEWSSKALHGRHRSHLCQAHVDKEKSNEWIRRGDLFPETEGFMLAIQDEVIATRNYIKHIIKDSNQTSDQCRHCNADNYP
ncbi:unnamed protein product [Colias eurytheme]|nr:unnamed protein product [Colias eurytheme]